jgi:hypothetical protein
MGFSLEGLHDVHFVTRDEPQAAPSGEPDE